MNGKSGNMNNVLQQIYPTGCFIPPDELIAVFDADQVRRKSIHGGNFAGSIQFILSSPTGGFSLETPSPDGHLLAHTLSCHGNSR